LRGGFEREGGRGKGRHYNFRDNQSY